MDSPTRRGTLQFLKRLKNQEFEKLVKIFQIRNSVSSKSEEEDLLDLKNNRDLLFFYDKEEYLKETEFIDYVEARNLTHLDENLLILVNEEIRSHFLNFPLPQKSENLLRVFRRLESERTRIEVLIKMKLFDLALDRAGELDFFCDLVNEVPQRIWIRLLRLKPEKLTYLHKKIPLHECLKLSLEFRDCDEELHENLVTSFKSLEDEVFNLRQKIRIHERASETLEEEIEKAEEKMNQIKFERRCLLCGSNEEDVFCVFPCRHVFHRTCLTHLDRK